MLTAVWDSSIVLAKYFERWPQKVAGKRCLDLSAGCGLVGIALAKLGAAQVVATDLEPNLALLHKNNEVNGEPLKLGPGYVSKTTVRHQRRDVLTGLAAQAV